MRPRSVTKISDTLYSAWFMDGNRLVQFDFTVNDNVVPSVLWEERFREKVGDDMHQYRPLFECILALHRANKEME